MSTRRRGGLNRRRARAHDNVPLRERHCVFSAGGKEGVIICASAPDRICGEHCQKSNIWPELPPSDPPSFHTAQLPILPHCHHLSVIRWCELEISLLGICHKDNNFKCSSLDSSARPVTKRWFRTAGCFVYSDSQTRPGTQRSVFLSGHYLIFGAGIKLCVLPPPTPAPPTNEAERLRN